MIEPKMYGGYVEVDLVDESEIENAGDIFTIDSDEKAEWALKKVLAAKKEKERLTALVNAERESLDRAQENIDARYENETSYLLYKLGEFFKTVEHKETKTQESYQLLSGKLVFKKPTQKLEQQKEALLEWCKENAPEYVKTEQSVEWGQIKKCMKIVGDSVIYDATGEIVQGVALAEVAGAFDVKA